MSLDNYNYWRDSRVIRAMTTRYYKIVEGARGKLLLTVPERYHEYLDLTDAEQLRLDEGLPVPACFAVCGTCSGHGTAVNPSIDCGGISDDDFRADPDFEEAYFSGMYDINCPECEGKRVVAQVKTSQLSGLTKRIWDWAQEWEEESARSARESAAERAMGA